MGTRLHNQDGDTRRDHRLVGDQPAARVRGGLSAWAVLTGIMVAVGAMAVIGAGLALVAEVLDLTPDLRTAEGTYRAGITVTAGVIVVQFLAYLWGGYTAGRMARGAGVANGLLVPLVMLVLGTAALAVGGSLGSGAEVDFGSLAATLPVDGDVVIDAGMVMAVGSIVAMILGGIVGGARGQRWHTRLEQRELSPVMVEDRATVADTGDSTGPVTAATPWTTVDDGDGAEGEAAGPVAAERAIDLRDTDPDEPVESTVERQRGHTSV